MYWLTCLILFASPGLCFNCEIGAADMGKIKVAAQTFVTIPLEPQLQPLYRDAASACHMRYLLERTQEVLDGVRQIGKIPVVDDIAMWFDILGTVLDGEIKQDVILLMDCSGAYGVTALYRWVIIALSRWCNSV
ncbi:uncharacterized protein HD556DRAFT_1311086 [Suillus plorans]|uniref:Uncharacterized protein n=1 Tax=Suillus plorans TaxID=116603 RepID=A0A9P7AHN3_9AGAM|nr:uncharacterized protein HD556DRAFT_1315154 [Suillus plorans]XP_041151996.1 uncharacterized protein HD556DRAFT_1315023 [Suillus plorans]XP_041156714.1 uncharacterized protein HD556DRAFT_1311086 [Suillus plorans]KAG1784346.1 hypothetical protein HD556DRAFT_1315154 [Suillus plorans]KAG1784511.1 hypothetical protein HD556DRAFT_1315023 [Suillus plorans]KAG1789684.1 hypothetical protein HD556DRAFT_1311086 [Suillus plorans]